MPKRLINYRSDRNRHHYLFHISTGMLITYVDNKLGLTSNKRRAIHFPYLKKAKDFQKEMQIEKTTFAFPVHKIKQFI